MGALGAQLGSTSSWKWIFPVSVWVWSWGKKSLRWRIYLGRCETWGEERGDNPGKEGQFRRGWCKEKGSVQGEGEERG